MTAPTDHSASTHENTGSEIDSEGGVSEGGDSGGGQLPVASIASLVKATAIALVLAIVLLLLVVLPAEYNIDPTGFGHAIGLTRLAAPPPPGDSDTPDASASDDGAAEENDGDREDRVEIEVPAGRGLEYKFALRTGERMKFEWSIDEDDEATLYYDFHGEPKGDTTGFFESYSISAANGAKGTFTAPFEGVHGWYFKNRTSSMIKVTLVTSGTYEVLGLR
ncbi:MAG: hypothetical protein O7G85_10675 [Planctomycetota bacterium]|nr:hypothetical protein [Planctomycetota bacterium]